MSETIAAENLQTEHNLPKQPALAVTEDTFVASFDRVNQLLSDRPLRRPNRTHPAPPRISHEKLKEIAKRNPPPPEWFEGEDECPF